MVFNIMEGYQETSFMGKKRLYTFFVVLISMVADHNIKPFPTKLISIDEEKQIIYVNYRIKFLYIFQKLAMLAALNGDCTLPNDSSESDTDSSVSDFSEDEEKKTNDQVCGDALSLLEPQNPFHHSIALYGKKRKKSAVIRKTPNLKQKLQSGIYIVDGM